MIVIFTTVLVPPLVVPVFTPWSGTNCRHQDINIKTGQARYSHYLWFIEVSERIEHTPLSSTLEGETVDVVNIKAWHRVNTVSLGGSHSPHYKFHGALALAYRMELIESLFDPTPERRKEIVRGILTAWQESGTYFGANDYVNQLLEEGSSKVKRHGVPPILIPDVI